ncbi:DnaJ-domain-containing protein 1 [Rhodoblastus acidophilus]|uniref:J domain-containing protein n=1 Tax=Rhodoblastus acidophilus TaxID=1074 RepID=UPI002224C9D0|nr:J domain-containing protein [Rhodoblastus acidophilus]MCW2319049.1 DnaJ-domain-containing protein 1 [Rhodoblastus acidophilus]
MKSISLYALFPTDRLKKLRNLRLPGQRLTTCAVGPLAALFGPTRPLPLASDRKTLGRALVEFQFMLETLLPLGPVLPAAFVCQFADTDALDAFLIAHAEKLQQALAEFGSRRQHQIAIRYDGSGAAPGADWPHAFETILREACVDVLMLPREDETVLFNAAVLIEGDGTERLDAALEKIDAFDTAALRIKCAGPLPACAFASVRAEPLAVERVNDACERLAVAREASLPDIKAAFRALMKVVHPDVRTSSDVARGAETAAREARDLLLRVREAELALDKAGRRFPAPPPALRFLRADSSGQAA